MRYQPALLALLLLLTSLTPIGARAGAPGPATYHLGAKPGDWAIYEVIKAEGNASLYGHTVSAGDELRFVLVGSYLSEVKQPSGELAFYVEWPRCDIYLNGHLIAENASTDMLWPFWPAGEDFWDAFSALNGSVATIRRSSGLALVEIEALGLEASWEVREDVGLMTFYEVRSSVWGMAFSMELRRASLLTEPGGAGWLSRLIEGLLAYWPIMVAALAVIVVAAMACLATRGGKSSWL